MKLISRTTYIPPAAARTMGIIVIVAVGAIDGLTGPAISFALFYLVPIAFVTWYGGIRFGIFCSMLGTGLALWGDLSSFHESSLSIQIWNSSVRLANFVGVALLLDYIHRLYHARIRMVESKYTHIVESVVEGIIATDLEGRIRFANERAAGILGLAQANVVGHHVLEFIIDEPSRELMRAIIGSRTKTSVPAEIQFIGGSGIPLWALAKGNVSQDEHGVVDGTVLLMTDISERKKSEDALRESELSYRTLVERMKEGLLKVDVGDRIQFVNEAFCEMVGYDRDELIGSVASDLLLSDDDKAFVKEKNSSRQHGMADSYELRLRRKSGEVIWVRVSGAPVMDSFGNAIGSIGVHTDITLQKEADQQLRRRYEEISAMQRLSSVLAESMHLHQRLDTALDTVLDVLSLDGGTIFLLDEGGKELILQHQRGLSPEVIERSRRWPVNVGLIGKVALSAKAAFVEDARDVPEIDPTIRELTGLRAIAEVPLDSKGRVLGVMIVFLRHPHQFTTSEQLMLRTFGKQIGIALENVQLYETARERERQIRRLSIDLVKVQEDERRRFARELHDGLSQVLTTLKINTELAAKHFRLEPDTAERHLEEALNLADEAQTEAKQLAYDLRPAILDDFGLKAAIAALTSNFERRTGIAVEFIAPAEDARFDSLLETSVYRVVQELLTNVAKHARATRVSIQLLMRAETLVLEVSDNGKGFDSGKGVPVTQASAHFGLRNIRERVEFFGGTFRTESLEGRGTEVMIELPIAHLTLPVRTQTTGA